jgi:hypothetical protein
MISGENLTEADAQTGRVMVCPRVASPVIGHQVGRSGLD